MDILMGIGAIVLPFVFLGLLLEGFNGIQYEPMTYDEEMEWLMKTHNLSWEEADEYASLPYRII